MEKQRYISPYTDFGFKYIFGSELNKEYLISFLNALFDLNDINNSNIKCFREGKEEGLKHGLAEGEKNKSLEIARNLKQLNMPAEQIQKATGLTVEEIEKL